MLDKIVNTLKNECKLEPGGTLLLGVSGGPDSMCLLHILCRLGYPLVAMHVNHKLRPDAEYEAHVVAKLAHSLGIKFITAEADVEAYSMEYSLSIEESARYLRYQLLFEQAKSNAAGAVIVGHNADDQVETILMHLLRGSGLSGLRGMDYRALPNAWSNEISLVRPLLSTWRKQIQAYLDEHQLVPLFDSSNLDVSYLRNRIRHELIPILEGYNPSIRETLQRMGASVREDHALLQHLVDDAWETVYIRHGEENLALRTGLFLEQPLSVQRLLLRKAVALLRPGLRDVDFETIERGLTLIAGAKPSTQTDLVAGLRLVKEGAQFWVKTWQAQLPAEEFPALAPGEERELHIPSTISLPHGWQFDVEEVQLSELSNLLWGDTLDPFEAWIDMQNLDQPLMVRVRKPGDKIEPLGLNGHSVKISDLMVNVKLPSRVRVTWPLVTSGDEVIWVPGYRISHQVRITPDTPRAVHIKLFRFGTT
jgi:tRNA(Ile)-lysidine synthase